MMSPRWPKTFLDRFWDYVETAGPEDCWHWMGATIKAGYGRFHVRGNFTKPNSVEDYAHRIMWEITYGPIPDGIQVLHSCDNPPCVNPIHLFLGTQSDNMKDAIKKGRLRPNLQKANEARKAHPGLNVRGESQGSSKLNSSDVLAIRRRYSGGDISQRKLAQEYKITQATLWSVLKRETWAHV